MEYLPILLVFLTIVLWFWALIDIHKHGRMNRNRTLWFFLILIFPMVGSIVYFQLGRSNMSTKRMFNPQFIDRN